MERQAYRGGNPREQAADSLCWPEPSFPNPVQPWTTVLNFPLLIFRLPVQSANENIS